jgi:branched-chain amino acid transport system substrate-binding protein
MMSETSRREFIVRSLAIATAASCEVVGTAAYAQTAGEVKFLLLAPLSGPNASSGALMRIGATLAVADINAAGGISALGGAKLRAVVADAGDSAERAKSATQRIISDEPDLIAGLGAWLSSFTLAATEITERVGLPWLTYSYSDLLTARGFKFILQTAPTASAIVSGAIPAVLDLAERSTGKRPKTIAAIADSALAAQSVMKTIREKVLAATQLKLVVDETYTPPLPDATSIVQKIRQARPDLLLIYASTIPDLKVIIETLHEFNLGGTHIPVVTIAPQNASPEVLANIRPELIEGMVVVVGNWVGRQQQDISDNLRRRSGEPWITEDILSTYGQVWLLKDALERAKVAQRAPLMEALRSTKLTGGQSAAKYFVGGHLSFDDVGRRIDSPMVVLQWQGGIPLLIGPASDAVAKPIWNKA